MVPLLVQYRLASHQDWNYRLNDSKQKQTSSFMVWKAIMVLYTNGLKVMIWSLSSAWHPKAVDFVKLFHTTVKVNNRQDPMKILRVKKQVMMVGVL